MNKLLLLITVLCALPLNPAFAVVQSFNNQTGQNQMFVDDVNIRINSASNLHKLNWVGVLGVNRGGTGASSFATGTIPFLWNGIFSEISSLGGSGLLFSSNDGLILPDQDISMQNSARIIWYDPKPYIGIQQSEPDTAYASLSSIAPDSFTFFNSNTSERATFNFESLTSDRIINFPDLSGTITTLEADQTFTGFNKFESSSNSTIYVGSSLKSGCIALGDSDGDGITYVTANGGILTSSSTKPSNCQ